ncbi:MAG: condensation domain-containing protein, partial [Desulfobacteraceae bacterium]
MSDLENILLEIRGLGIKLFIRDGKLRYEAPKGTLTKETKSQLHDNKDEIIQYLRKTKKEVSFVGGLITSVSRDSNLPLSFAQQRLWFIDQLGEKASQAYYILFSFKIIGALNRSALCDALDRIVERHEVLRTTFDLADGMPVQKVGPAQIGFALEENDISDRSEIEVRNIIEKEVSEPFDISAGPLIRGQLLKKTEEEHIFLLTMHHIVSDGWSMGIFMNELSALYQAFDHGNPDPLSELSIQYADYALWQRNWFKDEILEEQLNYWRTNLSGAPELLELPADKPRPAVQDYSGASIGIHFDIDLTRGLKEFSRRHGATMFMSLMTGWAILLSRLSGQEDLVVGTPVANRTRPEIEPLIGFFVNTLVLRFDLSDAPTISELMESVREATLSAQKHQDLPFEQLVEELQPERSLSYSPLFQVIFAWQNTPLGRMDMEWLTFELIDSHQATAQFDLSLSLQELGDEIVGSLNYATALFEKDSIERYIEYFKTLLQSMVRNDNQRIYQLELLSSTELNQVLYDWNDTKAEYPRDKCIHELFEEQVEKTPDTIAIVFEDERISYREINIRANQLANYLIREGVNPGDCVGLTLSRSIELVISEIAVLKCGGIYVPVDPEHPVERLSFMLSDCSTRLIIGRISDPELNIPWLDIDNKKWLSRKSYNSAIYLGGESSAYVMYTSGSTGEPKGVVISHQAIGRLAVNNGYANFKEDDNVAFAANPAFDATTMEVWGTLVNGGCVAVISQEDLLDPQLFAKILIQHQITMLFVTTAIFNQYTNQIPYALSRLRYLLTGGEKHDPDAFMRLIEEGTPQHLIHCYGPTETTTFAITHEIKRVKGNSKSIPLGRPISNTHIYL